jgi:WhiB family redox-sensing transcriptional regulator
MSRNDEHTPDFERRAAELDRLADVPTELLLDVVEQRGTCWWEVMQGGPPSIGDEPMPDRALRTAGAATTGVWGALCEVDRRALHTAWHTRRNRSERRQDADGGEQR